MKKSCLCVFLVLAFCAETRISNAQGDVQFDDWPEEQKIDLLANYSYRGMQEAIYKDPNNPDLSPVIALMSLKRDLGLYKPEPVPVVDFFDVHPTHSANDILQNINANQISNLEDEYNFQRLKSFKNSTDALGEAFRSTGVYIFAGGTLYGAAATALGIVTGTYLPGILAIGLGTQVFGGIPDLMSNLTESKMNSVLERKYNNSNPAIASFYLTDEEKNWLASIGPDAFKPVFQKIYENPGLLKNLNKYFTDYDIAQFLKTGDGNKRFEFDYEVWKTKEANDPRGLSKQEWAAESDDPNAQIVRNMVFLKKEAIRNHDEQQRMKTLENTEENKQILKELQKEYKALENKFNDVIKKLGEQAAIIYENNVNTQKQLEEIKDALKDKEDAHPKAVKRGKGLQYLAVYANNLSPLFGSRTARKISIVASLAAATGQMLVGYGEQNYWDFIKGLTAFVGTLGQLASHEQGPSFEKVVIDLMNTVIENQAKIMKEMDYRFDRLEEKIADMHSDLLRESYEVKKLIYQQTQVVLYALDVIRRNMNSIYDSLIEILLETSRSNYRFQESLEKIETKISLILDYNIYTRITILNSINETYKNMQYNVDKLALKSFELQSILPNKEGLENISEKSKSDLVAHDPGEILSELTNCAVNGSCDPSASGANIWSYDMDRGYSSAQDDGVNAISCKEYNLVLNNTQEIGTAKGLLGAYPKIFSYIKTIALIKKKKETNDVADNGKPKIAQNDRVLKEEAIPFENGKYPNMTLWEVATGLYLKLYNFLGRDPSDEIYNKAREAQITAIYDVTNKIDKFFNDTKDIDFINTITEAYKSKSEMIIEQLEAFIPNKESSKWDTSWFNSKLKTGYESLSKPIGTKGCNISMKLPDSLINSEIVQFATASGLITPEIDIMINRVVEEQNDYEQKKAKFDKYTIQYRLKIESKKLPWVHNDTVSQSFFLYNGGSIMKTPCTILETLIWGDEESLRLDYETKLSKATTEYSSASVDYTKWSNYDVDVEAEAELKPQLRPIEVVPLPEYEPKVRAIFFTDGDSSTEKQDSEQTRKRITENNAANKINNDNKKIEIYEKHTDKKAKQLPFATQRWEEAKESLRELKTIMGNGNVSNNAGIMGIFGVKKELERQIGVYFSKAENNTAIDNFIKDLSAETKDFILNEVIIKAMGLERHLCDLDLIYSFLNRIIALSYNMDLNSNADFRKNLENLMRSNDVIMLLNSWRTSDKISDPDLIKKLVSKSEIIEKIYSTLIDSAQKYQEKVGNGVRPRTGHYFYDKLVSRLPLLDNKQNNDYLSDEANLIEPIEPLIIYANENTAECKFDAVYDTEGQARKLSYVNIMNIIETELNKHNNPELVKGLSMQLIMETDEKSDIDLKKMGVEYFAKSYPSVAEIIDLFKKQTNSEIKIEIINKLFTLFTSVTEAEESADISLDQDSMKILLFALEIMSKPKEDLDVRWVALNYLSAYSKSLIKLTNTKSEEHINNIGGIIEEVLNELHLGVYFNCMKTFNNLEESFNGYIDPVKLSEGLSGLVKLKQSKVDYPTCPRAIIDLPKLASTGLDIADLIANQPELLGMLTNVKELDLSNLGLRTIPESIENLTNLRSLNLDCNNFDSIPYSIGKLTSLESLNLCNNNIVELQIIINAKDSIIHSQDYGRILNMLEPIEGLVNFKEFYIGDRCLRYLSESIAKFNKGMRMWKSWESKKAAKSKVHTLNTVPNTDGATTKTKLTNDIEYSDMADPNMEDYNSGNYYDTEEDVYSYSRSGRYKIDLRALEASPFKINQIRNKRHSTFSSY